MDFPDDLVGKSAVVTGATSGIGAAVCRRLARAGARIVLGGRDAERAKQLAEDCSDLATDVEVATVLGDVSDPTTADELVDAALQFFGRLDIVVNAAGTITRGDATTTSNDDWHRNMAVNAGGVFFVSRAAVTAMRSPATGESAGGSIVNVASNVGLVGSPGLAAYCASKGAIITLTKAMALDHAEHGIRVNAVCPGAVETPMLFSGHEPDRSTDEITASNIDAIPQGRIATPEEVADAVLFLTSGVSSHITGVALPIDGGYLAQ